MLDELLFSGPIGCLLTSPILWGLIVSVIGLKLYNIRTTKKCPSTKRHFGKTIIVTGPTSGIGREIAMAMAFRGMRVILACRDTEKGQKVREEIIARSKVPITRVAVYHLDLSSLSSVRKFVEEIKNNEEHIDVLINNAGATGLGNKKTADGIQIGMQVNHYAPFLLTALLLDKMKQRIPSRVIWVSSKLHGCAKLDLDNLNCEKSFDENQVYFTSKLANIMVSYELSKRLYGTGITVNVCHPGFTATPIWHHLPPGLFTLWSFILEKFFKNPFEASQTAVYLAVDPFLDNVSGKYFEECAESVPSKKALNDITAKRVLEKSICLVGLKPEEIHFQI